MLNPTLMRLLQSQSPIPVDKEMLRRNLETLQNNAGQWQTPPPPVASASNPIVDPIQHVSPIMGDAMVGFRDSQPPQFTPQEMAPAPQPQPQQNYPYSPQGRAPEPSWLDRLTNDPQRMGMLRYGLGVLGGESMGSAMDKGMATSGYDPKRYEMAQDPYGFGGAGQVDPVTGQIINYQKAPVSTAKSQLSPLNQKDYTAASWQKAIRPDGTVDRSKLEPWRKPSATGKREIKKDVNGINRYTDTGEKVFGSVKEIGKGGEKPDKFRKEWTSVNKEFTKSRDAYKRVLDSSKEPSAAGDLALIFNYMKILDPGSVVRESEFATAAATGAFGERIKAFVQRIEVGTRLSHEMRKDFVDRATQLYKGQLDIYSHNYSIYKGIAERSGLKAEDVVPGMTGGVQVPKSIKNTMEPDEEDERDEEERALDAELEKRGLK